MFRESIKITESVVEQAALEWLGGLGYDILEGLPQLLSGEFHLPSVKENMEAKA